MVKLIIDKDRQEILKELVDNERANFKVIKNKDRLPKRLKEYKKELDSLSKQVSNARSV